MTETPEKPSNKTVPSQNAAVQSDPKIRSDEKPKRRAPARKRAAKPAKKAVAKKPTARAKKPAASPAEANQMIVARTPEKLVKITSAWREKGAKVGSPDGVVPACVEACPAEARFFGDLDDPESEVSKLLATRNSIKLREEMSTEPKTIYLPR